MRLLIIGLLAFIGYAPCSLAYGVVYAPPVSKQAKKKKAKHKLRKVKRAKKIKTSTGLLIAAVILAVPGVVISALASTLPLGVLILGLCLLLIALTLAIVSLILASSESKKSDGDGSSGLGGKDKNTSGNLGD